MPEEKSYRIVWNTLRYRIQKRTRRRFLWWTWERWDYVREYDETGSLWPISFGSSKEAEDYIKSLCNRDKQLSKPWTTVATYSWEK